MHSVNEPRRKAPVFTYIITWLNPVIPPSLISILGACFILYTDEAGNPALTWMEMHFQASLAGCFVCLAVSLGYYISIRNGRLRPRWWMNLLLIIFGYAIIPLLSLIILEAPTREARLVAPEFWIISPVAFLITTFRTGKHRRNPRGMMTIQKLKSPWWIPAFIPAYYVLFFGTLMMSTELIGIGFYSLGWLLHKAHTVLRIPFFTELTFDLVKQYLPGPKAHLVILLNAIGWAVAAWWAVAWLRKKRETSKRVLEEEPGNPDEQFLPELKENP